MRTLIKKPSAWLPIVMSLAVLATILIYIALSGTPTQQPDEGTVAHLFQIWIVIECLMVGFFAVTWLPKIPKQAFIILMIQIIATLTSINCIWS